MDSPSRPLLFLVPALLVCLLLGWVIWDLAVAGVGGEDASTPGPVELIGTGDRSKAEEARTTYRVDQSADRRRVLESRVAQPLSFAQILDAGVTELHANRAIGLSGPGGKYGGRRGGRKRLRSKKRSTAKAIERGLEWLVAHQSADGRWDSDGFMRTDETGIPCDGGGSAVHDVGVTALVLLTLLGDGSTVAVGPHATSIRNAIVWLQSQQEKVGPNRGRITGTAHQDFIYDHVIATCAMCEAYGMSHIEVLKGPAQLAIDYLETHRNPRRTWGYGQRSAGCDLSITTWALMAYRTASDFELRVPREAFTAIGEFLDEVTDAETGRAGYSRLGEPASRRGGDWTRFPAAKTESLTALGLVSRFLLGQNPRNVELMRRAANTLLTRPIAWTPGEGNIDCYYWWFGTQSMYQMGRKYWSEWSKRLAILLRHQREDGNAKGSWDPVGAWGPAGGRLGSTAMIVLTLESYYRLTRMVR